jgi:hypothetical protein
MALKGTKVGFIYRQCCLKSSDLIGGVCALQAQLPREVQGHERITAQLSGGMALIEAAIDNRALPLYTMPGSRDAYSAAAAAAATQGPASSRWGGGAGQATAEPTLRQMVEVYAEQNNIDFVPKSGRREQGLQVGPSSQISPCPKSMQGFSRRHSYSSSIGHS